MCKVRASSVVSVSSKFRVEYMLNRRRSTSYPAPRSDVFKQGFVSQTKLKDHCEANLRTKPLHFICKCSRALGHCVALCLPTDSCHLQ